MLDGLIQFTLAEASSPRAGAGCIRLRLSELMFVEVVRRYLEALPAGHTDWLSGLSDPAIGRVLSMLHERPDHAWTLSEMAERAGISQAVLAVRFSHLVGGPPIQYLTLWRMSCHRARVQARTTACIALSASAQHERVTHADRLLQEVVGRFNIGGSPKVTHWTKGVSP